MLINSRSRGFTLIEFMVVVAIIAILMALATPAFTIWTANARTRTVAEVLQNTLRQAQAEAVKRNRVVALVFTNSTPSSNSSLSTPASPASNWAEYALPMLFGGSAAVSAAGSSTFIEAFIQSGGNVVQVTSPLTALCFNSVGRLVAQNTPIGDAGGATCTLPTNAAPVSLDISNVNGDRALRVQVSLGGKVRMCDPVKLLPAQPEGCNE